MDVRSGRPDCPATGPSITLRLEFPSPLESLPKTAKIEMTFSSQRQYQGVTMKKFERLICLIYMLRQRPVRAKEIAERLGIAERTVYRDINELNEALDGYVRVHGDENGYSLDETLYAPPLHFIDEEIEALQTAVSSLDKNNPHTQLARQALSKMQSHSGARPGLMALEQHLEVMQPLAKDRTPIKRLQELEQHLRKKRVLKLDYFSHNSGKTKPILFAPYALLFRKNAWYLLGHHQEKGLTLLLRAYRIQTMELTDQPFELPPDFSVGQYFKTHWEVFDGKPEPIHLRFRGEAAWRIQEMTWHRSQEIQKQPDGAIDLKLEVSANPEFKTWVLGWGAQCEVLAPLKLKTALQTEVQQLAQVYANQPSLVAGPV